MVALALVAVMRRWGVDTDWMPRLCGKVGAFASVSAIGYLLVTVPLLGSAPVAVTGLRTTVIALAAVIMLRRNGFPLSREPDGTACALTGFGLVWIELTELDEHVFDVFALTTPFGHLAFHGLGLAAMLTGLLGVAARHARAPGAQPPPRAVIAASTRSAS